MKVTLILAFVLLFFARTALSEGVTNALTNQGGVSGKFCDTTGDLAANTFYQISSDNAFQACDGEYNLSGDGDDSCDQDSAWNYVVHGHVTFGPPSSGVSATTVEVKTYIGDDMILCTGGSS